jgi:hypothetical protein
MSYSTYGNQFAWINDLPAMARRARVTRTPYGKRYMLYGLGADPAVTALCSAMQRFSSGSTFDCEQRLGGGGATPTVADLRAASAAVPIVSRSPTYTALASGESYDMSKSGDVLNLWRQAAAKPSGPFADWANDPKWALVSSIGTTWSDADVGKRVATALNAMLMTSLPANWQNGKIPLSEMMTFVLGARGLFEYSSGTKLVVPVEPLDALRQIVSVYMGVLGKDGPSNWPSIYKDLGWTKFGGTLVGVPATVDAGGHVLRDFAPIPLGFPQANFYPLSALIPPSPTLAAMNALGSYEPGPNGMYRALLTGHGGVVAPYALFVSPGSFEAYRREREALFGAGISRGVAAAGLKLVDDPTAIAARAAAAAAAMAKLKTLQTKASALKTLQEAAAASASQPVPVVEETTTGWSTGKKIGVGIGALAVIGAGYLVMTRKR